MSRSELAFLLLASTVPPLCLWLALRPEGGAERLTSGAPEASSRPTLAPVPASGHRDPVDRPLQRGRRAAAPGSGRPEATAESRCAVARVTGRLTRAGLPLAGRDVVFQRLAEPHSDDEDWDFTDASGAFEVRVPPGAYAVLDEDGAWITSLVIPSGEERARLDIELP